jgi:hypothetical protein
MKILLLAVVLAGCGIRFNPADIVEPLDDSPAPFYCDSQYFGSVESESQIDCGVFEADAKLATDMVVRLTKVDSNSYYRIMRRTTVHVRSVVEWGSGSDTVKGQAWFQRIDIGSSATALAHETLHVYSFSHWEVNSGDHPGWIELCPDDSDSRCNYYLAANTYADQAKTP